MHFLLILLGKMFFAGLAIIAFIFLLASFKIKRLAIVKKYRRLTAAIIIASVLIYFLLGRAMNDVPSTDFFMHTAGPSIGPQLPITSAIEFLLHADSFRQVPDIARNPAEVPQRTSNTEIYYTLETEEVINEVAPGVYVNSWTFNGQIPGPMLRAKVGDTIHITIRNKANSLHEHNVDFHAVNGPGGGASVTTVKPGEEKNFTFKAINPGLFVYHCAAMGIPGVHMAHGQYGLILIEPAEGLPPVDKEFYIVQGEIYTSGAIGSTGLRAFDTEKYLDGEPTYVVFNGRVGGLNDKMNVKVGDRVRLYVGNGGVNLVSSFHVIGEILDAVYPEGGWPVQHNIQTTLVPAGGATMVEFTVNEPGKYTIVDHALARVDKGAWGILAATGQWNSSIYAPQPAPPAPGMMH